MPMKKTLLALGLAAIAALPGCSASADVDRVPVGTKVDVTRADGGVVQGTLVSRDDRTVKIDVGPATREVPRRDVKDVAVVDGSKPAKLPAAAKFREYTIPAGRTLMIRLDSPVSSASARVEDSVDATLVQPVFMNDVQVIPEGAGVLGQVQTVTPAGKVKGRASLAVRFHTLTMPETSERYPIAADFQRIAPATKSDDARKIGLPAAGGAIVGAIIGGKKGAAIGAVVGGGAGTAAVLATPGKEISLPAGTRLEVPLGQAIDIKVPIRR
jgi:hypothetical protein